MYVGLKTILKVTEEGSCTISTFNVHNMELVLGVMNAAKKTGAPVIFQMYSWLFDHQNARYVAPVILEAIRELDTPAASRLDHGAGITGALRALRYEAAGVMIDVSVFPLGGNMETTRSVMKVCEACGVSVEGELGHVGTVRGTPMSEHTDMEEAKQFVREAGVVALAIMVGTAHGRYERTPVLGIGRIRDIRAATETPLVPHGGFGVSDEQVPMAVEAGVRKVNSGADLCYSFLDRVLEVDQGIYALDLFMEGPIQTVKEFVIGKIRLLGADTK